MYKVLLVDDEMFVRKGLRSLINWEELSFTVVGEAENGEEGLNLIGQLQPDLVIADIRMPVLDGLELIRAVTMDRKRDPVFIIVSGYHDFTYAQQALRYGVHDYILKPIDEVQLEATLKKLAGMLNLRRLANLTGDKLVSQSIVETLIQRTLSDKDAVALASALQMEESAGFVYILAEIQKSEEQACSVKGLTAALQSLSEWKAAKWTIYEQEQGMYGLLLQMDSILTAVLHEEKVYARLHTALSAETNTSVTLYIGNKADRLRDVKASYRTANEALSYKYAEDGAAVIYASRVLGTPLYYFDVKPELYGRLLEKLEESKQEEYIQDTELLFNEFQAKRFAPSAVSNAVMRFVIGVITIIREMDGSEKELQLLPKMMEWPKNHGSLQDLKPLFVSFISEASAYIAALRREQARGGIERIKKYIEANYMENINLKSLAGKFYMNAVYLGQLFRKTYGVYFNDFLLGIRVFEAKKLLRQTDLRMYEVAERVGFQNADYFVTQFEKLEKMSPTDYRNYLVGKK